MRLTPVAVLTALILLAGTARAQDPGVDEGEEPPEPSDESAGSDAAGSDAAGSDMSDMSDGSDSAAASDESDESEWDRWFGEKFMDTRISFVFNDDNVLAGPEDRSRQPSFMPVDDRGFNENLQTEKRGRETETHLVLYKRMPSYFKHLDAEAALVLELENYVDEVTAETQTNLGDDGSYIKLNVYTVADDFDGDHVSLTLFPFDSQRFLLGYTYDITWGGEKIFPKNDGQVPGVRLRYDFNVDDDHEGYAFVGVKTASLLNKQLSEHQTYYGFLGGLGLALTPWLGWDLGGGYFQRGAYPFQGCDSSGEEVQADESCYEPLAGKTMDAFGGSTRVVFHQGLPIQDSVDFRLYRVTPDADAIIATPQRYGEGWSWSVGGEFTYVMQSLIDFEQADSTEIVPSKAAAANGKVMWNRARLHADFIYRDLSYVVFDIPGVFPYYGFPDAAEVRPEWFFTAGLDYYFETPRLTPGLIFAYKQPASYAVTGADGQTYTLVYRDDTDLEILPAGEGAFDILALKLSLKWDLAPAFVLVGEVKYTLDKNASKIGENNERVYHADNVTNQLGFAVLAQAKF